MFLGRQPKVEDAIEMADDLIVTVKPSVVKIRRIEVGVQQGRRLEQAAGTDIVLEMIDESSRRHVAGCATHGRIVRKRLDEKHLAAAFGIARSRRQTAGRAEA